MGRIGRQVRVSGRVQGVFFRAWTQQEANELGVTGWVRNAPDGSVEAHLTGEESAVQQMIARLHEGPRSAVVRNVEATVADPDPGDCFEVRH